MYAIGEVFNDYKQVVWFVNGASVGVFVLGPIIVGSSLELLNTNFISILVSLRNRQNQEMVYSSWFTSRHRGTTYSWSSSGYAYTNSWAGISWNYVGDSGILCGI